MKDFINKINNKEDLTLNEMQEVINSITKPEEIFSLTANGVEILSQE